MVPGLPWVSMKRQGSSELISPDTQQQLHIRDPGRKREESTAKNNYIIFLKINIKNFA